MELTKWEYKIEHGDFGQEKLNEWGNEGWELVTVIPGEPDQYTHFFKRPKQPKRY
jgi:hypothetical protein